MVTSKTILERTGIPRTTLYRLVDDGTIPAQEVTKPWHKRKRYLFCLAEVEAAINAPKPKSD